MPIGAVSPTSVLQAIGTEALRQGTPWLLIGYVLTTVLLRTMRSVEDVRSRLQFLTFLIAVHLLLLPATGFCVALDSDVARELHLTGSIASAIAGIGLVGLVMFGVITPRLRLAFPRILQDVLVAGAATIAVFGTASRAGVNLSGIVATGAVLTAVIGLALQDTLGNVLGGLSMQLDSTVRVGDWIRVQEITGRVVEIRWRSTSIETRNWETVIIPNSVLTRTQITVLARRQGEEPRWRRWVYFNVDYRYPPTQVIDLITRALRAQPIQNVAATPEPNCVLMDFTDSSARYAVRYYLLDLAVDDPTDSVVRTRVYYALTRAGIQLAIPAHAVFMTEDSMERRTRKQKTDSERRTHALSRIAFFRDLSEAELEELAESMHRAPFAPGEVLTHQGAEAHHLYIIDRGRVSVRVKQGSHETVVSELGDNEFFGEMSLLTGEKRAATVVALTDVECYRLDAAAFRHLLERRADLAAKVAEQLAERRVELTATSAQLADRQTLIDRDKLDLLHKIREFFGL